MSGGKRQTCKVFVGGLSWETTDQRLRNYFENYGAVSEAFVSFDRVTGRPRGFGFVVFEDPSVADKVVSIQHTIDRREVEAKKAVPKEENPASRTASGALNQRTKKIFVGGLAQSVDDQAFRRYFEQYGQVEDAVVMYDHDNKRPRGFGFVTFAAEEGVDQVFTNGALQTLHDKPIEIKRAVPRDQIASARGRAAYSGNGTPRLEGAPSGPFGNAAMASAFGDDGSFATNLLHSHSLNAPGAQPHIQRLASAASMGGGQLPLFSPELSQSLGLTNQIYQALSGQLSGNLGAQMNNQYQTQIPNNSAGLNVLANNNLLSMARAGSNQLASMGSTQLPQGTNLQQLGSTQLPPLHNMGSTQLASAKSGLLDHNYGALSNGLQNGMSGSLGHSDFLGQDFSNPQNHYTQENTAFSNAPPNGYTDHSSPLRNHYTHQDTAFATNGQPNGYADHSSAFAQSAFAGSGSAFSGSGSAFTGSGSAFNGSGSAFGKENGPFTNTQVQDLDRAFSSMALEHRPSFKEANIPNASQAFEERVQMLSAGSAGLGQLPSPKLPSPYARQNNHAEPNSELQRSN